MAGIIPMFMFHDKASILHSCIWCISCISFVNRVFLSLA